MSHTNAVENEANDLSCVLVNSCECLSVKVQLSYMHTGSRQNGKF